MGFDPDRKIKPNATEQAVIDIMKILRGLPSPRCAAEQPIWTFRKDGSKSLVTRMVGGRQFSIHAKPACPPPSQQHF